LNDHHPSVYGEVKAPWQVTSTSKPLERNVYSVHITMIQLWLSSHFTQLLLCF